MIRRALIIACPDKEIPGVRQDAVNYRRYLLSALGGAWESGEIVALESPTRQQVNSELDRLESAEYSMVIFSGHGYHPSRLGSPHVILRAGVEIDGEMLKRGAQKHTLIFDCCRRLEREPLQERRMSKAMDSLKRGLDASDCRLYFDKNLSTCPAGLVVLHACGFDEISYESSASGGWYSSALVDAAREWQINSSVDTSRSYDVLTIPHAHDAAATAVIRQSGNRQHPARDQPRTGPYFPFAIVA